MPEKRKLSFEQDQALARGRDVARANQRRRVAAREAAERAQAERERERAEVLARCERGFHGWKNWEYAEDYKTETRVCRECGLTETREVRL